MMEQNALLVVAKRPAPGQTKTRLCPPLSPHEAARLYECFLLDTLEIARRVPGACRAVAYMPESERAYFLTLAPDFELVLQEGNRLGERLDHCLTVYLTRGFKKVVIMSSDTPTLPPQYVHGAFTELDHDADVVIGPCGDGGYYLIGLKQPAPALLREVPMSTPRVTADTLALAEAEGLKTALLPYWYDVDDVQSLSRLSKEIRKSGAETTLHTRQLLMNPSFRTKILG